jgi:hypothetical protein
VPNVAKLFSDRGNWLLVSKKKFKKHFQKIFSKDIYKKKILEKKILEKY